MNIVSLNVAPTVNYAPAVPQSPPFSPTPVSKTQTYTVSITAQFETEDEAKAFARHILGIKCFELKENT